MADKDFSTPAQARLKLEHYCAYQDRCHEEVRAKLRDLGMDAAESDQIIVHLLEHNFLNEERFARSFARGKHRIKQWGKVRIVNELKFRNLSVYNINAGLTEIDADEYLQTLHTLAERTWNSIRESHPLRKKKKFCDFLMRKGYESHLIYAELALMA